MQVIVLSDATASATDQVQAANLHDLNQIGIRTPTVEDWVASLLASVAEKEAI